MRMGSKLFLFGIGNVVVNDNDDDYDGSKAKDRCGERKKLLFQLPICTFYYHQMFACKQQ